MPVLGGDAGECPAGAEEEDTDGQHPRPVYLVGQNPHDDAGHGEHQDENGAGQNQVVQSETVVQILAHMLFSRGVCSIDATEKQGTTKTC